MIFPVIAYVAIALACLAQIVFLVLGKEGKDVFSHFLLAAGAVFLLAHLVYRSILIRFVAVTNMYESLILFAALVSLVLFFYRLRSGDRTIRLVMFGGSMIAFIMLALASSPLLPSDVQPPIPALQSYWLVLHITLAFIGEAFFVVAFVAAILYLFTKDPEKRSRLDRLTYTAIAIGYPIFTAGALIFGAVWAHFAWGSFWSWDPKETWALVTWLVYTLYLHSRFVKRLRGTISALIAIAGFLVTIFTFLGVNYLITGLHSYV